MKNNASTLGLAFMLSTSSAAALTSCASTSSSSASTIAAGSQAPAFSAADQSGAVRTLESFKGRALVLFFYPKDGSPGCTKEACAFRDAWQRYEAANVTVVGVSTDSVASHAAFAAEHKLPFSLLADTDEAMLRAYGVGSTFGMAKRVTFVIDGAGTVVRIFPDVDPGVHADEVLAVAGPLTQPTTTETPQAATPTTSSTPLTVDGT